MGMSPVRRAFLILLVAAAVVALGLLFAQDQVTLRMRSGVSAEDARHPDYVAALVGTELSRGNAFDVLTNGDQIFPVDARRDRRRAAPHQLRDLHLRHRARSPRASPRRSSERRGAASRSTSSSTRSAPARWRKTISSACARPAAASRSSTLPAWYSLEEINYRTHRKILVVDGETAFTGGVGVADHWLGNADSKEHWRDTQVRVRGPVVRMMEAAFYENFLEADGTDAARARSAAASRRRRRARRSSCAARRAAAATI